LREDERARQALGVEGGTGLVIKKPSRVRPGLSGSGLDQGGSPLKIGQLPDATAGALPRVSKGQGRSGSQLAEEAVHPYITQTLAAERIKDWQQQAAWARRAKEARRARRAWMMPAAARLVLLLSSHVPPAPARPVAGRLGAAEGRPAAAEERRPESTRAA
jgi:hypothetical protein